MNLAILADIHANQEALTACLAHAERLGVEAYAFLGDLVGYGADPEACLAIIQRHATAGAILVRGNHDEAALAGHCLDMNPAAREAALWTRTRLSATDRDFLAGLPYTVERDGTLFVHASADLPPDWEYVSDERAARRCLAATSASLIFAGHVHHPLLFHSLRDPGREGVAAFVPQAGSAITLTPGRRWLALAGSVGQPRDGNPAAAYLLFDTAGRQLTWQRVPYDWMSAAAKIRAAGLPEVLAQRLGEGW
jgi:diadenosine tetraphosphatase ApaH/serine/threonine PP2A family protein phosphatase